MWWRPLFLLFLPLAMLAGVALATPRVVVTVAPVEALVAGVLEGVARPAALIEGMSSPHTHAMRPSEIARLRRADLIVWVGPALESWLRSALRAIDSRHIVTLSALPGMSHRPIDGVASADPHLWLDPANARQIAAAVADRLVSIDPANTDRYRANLEKLQTRLLALQQELARTLAPVRHLPFLVYHDAYSGFVKRFGLNQVGAVTLDPDLQPGARTLARLHARMMEGEVVCLFHEPRFTPPAVERLVSGTMVRTGVLDPLGEGEMGDAAAYDALLRGLARNLIECLGGE